jgi:hypothetical protein
MGMGKPKPMAWRDKIFTAKDDAEAVKGKGTKV